MNCKTTNLLSLLAYDASGTFLNGLLFWERTRHVQTEQALINEFGPGGGIAFQRVHPSDVKRPVDGILSLAVGPGTARMCGDDAQPSRLENDLKQHILQAAQRLLHHGSGQASARSALCGRTRWGILQGSHYP